jgi:hypothetical protein
MLNAIAHMRHAADRIRLTAEAQVQAQAKSTPESDAELARRVRLAELERPKR